MKNIPISVSCIIPAFNEATRIPNILDVVTQVNSLKEIIVVDDGSTDETSKVVKRYSSVTLLQQYPNQGKAAAVIYGVEQARGDTILLLDADLQGLTQHHVETMVQIAQQSTNVWAIGGAKDGMGMQEKFGFDLYSGERIFPKQGFLELHLDRKSRYGIEALLNDYMRANYIPVKIIPMPGVVYQLKIEKFGIFKGWIQEFRMTFQILSVIGIRKAIAQFFWYLKLSSSYKKGTLLHEE